MSGGGFSVDVNGVPFRGEYLEVDSPHRVVVSWGISGSRDFPPGSSRVEFTLTATTTGTLLRLVHTALPHSNEQGHAAGWSHYLARLHLAAIGTDPGVDSFIAPNTVRTTHA